ncbi:O-antigen ligase family protein [Crocinitomix sp.]|nr:O-antigen ligase family protein [Crocinitomix sp.]
MISLKRNTVDKLLVLLMIFIGSKGNLIALSDVTLVFTLLFSFYHFQKRGKKYTRQFALFSGAYLIISIIFLLKFDWINISSSIRLFIKLLVGYQVISTIGLAFLIHYERYIYVFAAISLPFFAIQLISYEGLKLIIGFFENAIPGLDYRGDWYVNSFFFTLNDNAEFRNSGMAWEPKGFANMIDLAIIFNLMRNKFKINKRLIILTLALITTFSTLGYLVLCIVIPVLYVINIKSRQKKIIAFFLGAIVVVSVLSLDFMLSKITSEIENRESHFVYIDNETDARSVTLGRFGSMALAVKDFPKNPWVGIGMQDKERTQGKYTRLVWVSGLADFLSRFGIIGVIFLILTYFKSSILISQTYGYNGGWIIFTAFMMIFFASAIIINPLFFCFQFLPFANLSSPIKNNDEK